MLLRWAEESGSRLFAHPNQTGNVTNIQTYAESTEASYPWSDDTGTRYTRATSFAGCRRAGRRSVESVPSADPCCLAGQNRCRWPGLPHSQQMPGGFLRERFAGGPMFRTKKVRVKSAGNSSLESTAEESTGGSIWIWAPLSSFSRRFNAGKRKS